MNQERPPVLIRITNNGTREAITVRFAKEDTLYVPIWEKTNLTVEEAASYSGVGRNKIKELSNDDRCPFVLWVGTKRLIKRKQFDEYLEKMFSI